MSLTKSQRRGALAIAIALVLHLGLGVVLYLLHMTGRIPPPKATELLLVDVALPTELPAGGSEAGATAPPEEPLPIATPQPKPTPEPPRPTTPKPTKPTPAQPLVTQRHEESLQVAERERERLAQERAREQAARQAREQERLEREREAREQAAREQAAREKVKRREAQRNRARGNVAGAFASGRGQGSQGAGSGDSGAGAGTASGRSSGSYDLGGRSIVSNGGNLTRPITRGAIRGQVNVRIVVNSAGRVIEARVEPRGTTIVDNAVRQAAIDAARSTTFNAREGVDEQRGTISYLFEIG